MLIEKYFLHLPSSNSKIENMWHQFQHEGDFCDLTFVCGDKQIQAHKIVVSASSPVFMNILKSNSNPLPFIYFPGIQFSDLLNLVIFMYQGEVSIDKEDIERFLSVAQDLQIKGLLEEKQENCPIKTYSDDGHTPMQGNLDKLVDFVNLMYEGEDNVEEGSEGYLSTANDLESKGLHQPNLEICHFDSSNNDELASIESRPLTDNHDESYSYNLVDDLIVSQNILTIEENVNKTEEIIPQEGTVAILEESKNTNTDSGNESKLISHDGIIFACNECDYKSRTKGNLKIHINAVHKRIINPCTQCDYKTTRKGKLRNHVQVVHEGKLYPCSQCDLKVNQREILKRHVNKVHKGIRFPCPQCDYKATAKNSIKIHIMAIHDGLRTYFTCSQCDYKVLEKRRMKIHVKKMHIGELESSVEKNIDQRILTTKQNMKQTDQKFPCGNCDKSYSSKFYFDAHTASSTCGGMRFLCDRCDYKAIYRVHLQDHIDRVHEGKRYTCSQCDYSSVRKFNLKIHIKEVHEGVCYRCSQCDYKATKKTKFTDHVKRVHENKYYPCSQCDYKPSKRCSLRAHVKAVHDGFRFPCPHCEFTATFVAVVNQHVKKCHT